MDENKFAGVGGGSMNFWDWLNQNPGWFALYLFMITSMIVAFSKW